MKEELLHYVWRLKRFDLHNLETTEGEAIQIQKSGEHNYHSGPDFTNARIYIGDTLWAGNVEIHLKSSDWLLHNHQNDKAYDNVILHVVLKEDRPVFRTSGERLPCLELRKRIPPKLSKIYLKLLHNEFWIPCQHHFFEVGEITKNLWLDRLLVERLEQKTEAIRLSLEQNQNNWEESFYHFIARNFGVKVNADPFESLAKSLPLITLAKHKNDLFQIEALLFGQAGLLEEEFNEAYPNRLKKEYMFLKKKYSLAPIATAGWRFLRLRPANFPTIRIAQFATLIYQSLHLFSKILEVGQVAAIEKLFAVKLSDYWLTHYVFDKESVKRNKTLGKTTIHLLLINTITPFLFLYGKMRGEDAFKVTALKLLEEVPPERNSTVSKWKELGMLPKSAYQTQALLQLKNNYCTPKKCLNCPIGNAILK